MCPVSVVGTVGQGTCVQQAQRAWAAELTAQTCTRLYPPRANKSGLRRRTTTLRGTCKKRLGNAPGFAQDTQQRHAGGTDLLNKCALGRCAKWLQSSRWDGARLANGRGGS